MSRKILAAVDLSRQSIEIFNTAKSIAGEEDQLLLVHVVPDPSRLAGFHVPHVSMEKAREELLEDAGKQLERFCRRYARGVPTLLRYGIPYKEILAAAKEEAADLIVIGRREGGGSMEHVFVPSTSKNVLLKAECDVKVVNLPLETEEDLGKKPVKW